MSSTTASALKSTAENDVVACRICGLVDSHQMFTVREMMYGTGEEFCYFQCKACQTLQILQIPSDLNPYYPNDYYSLNWRESMPVISGMQRLRDRYAAAGEGILGRLLFAFWPNPALIPLRSLKHLKLSSPILDVGSGMAAMFLRQLQRLGYCNLLGIDPYLKSDVDISGSLRLRRRTIDEIDGKFDLVTFHHVFEHISDPADTLRAIKRILAPAGTLLIRMPTVSSFAWRNYGVDWVQLDPPRHLHLFSLRSISLIAEEKGFRIRKIVYDSEDFQFWGSQKIALGIPVLPKVPPNFLARLSYRRKAARLNLANDGDSAAYFLTHS